MRSVVIESTAPVRTYTGFDKPRPLSWYLVDGKIPEGHEASGLLFPFRVMDAPAMHVVIGEITYSDGRRFLDFGMNPDWIEANTDYQFRGNKYPDWYCPDCDGKNGEHQKITIPDPSGKPLTMKCPRDTNKGWRR